WPRRRQSAGALHWSTPCARPASSSTRPDRPPARSGPGRPSRGTGGTCESSPSVGCPPVGSDWRRGRGGGSQGPRARGGGGGGGGRGDCGGGAPPPRAGGLWGDGPHGGPVGEWEDWGRGGAVVAAPHDAPPRLILADWLEEHGQPERAEFIRVQCQLAQADDDAPEYPALRRREQQLWLKYKSLWRTSLPPRMRDLPFPPRVVH